MERPDTGRVWELDLDMLKIWLYHEDDPDAEWIGLDDQEAWELLRYFEYVGIMMEPNRWVDQVVDFHRKWVEYTNPCAEIDLGWTASCNLEVMKNVFPLPGVSDDPSGTL